MGIRGELFSKVVQLDKRTYFFNVKENRFGDLYLNIVESKNKDSGGFERQSVVLFADDLQAFLGGFDEALKILEKSEKEKRKTARPKRIPEGGRTDFTRSDGGERPGRPQNDRHGGRESGGRDAGSRTPGGRDAGSRTPGGRAPGGRAPFQKKPFNDRALSGERSYGERSYGDGQGSDSSFGGGADNKRAWKKKGPADSHSRPKKAGSVARTTGVGPKRKVRAVKPRD